MSGEEMNDAMKQLVDMVIPSETLARLTEQVIAAADQQGVLDIGYRTVESPIGDLLVAATPKGVIRVAFALEDHDRVLEQLSDQVSPRIMRAPRRLDPVARQLDDYFAGRPVVFDVPLDLSRVTPFRREVLQHLRHIARGGTESYAEVAAELGNPRAVRAVGTACARNPVPILVPCHRVVRSDGSMGGYLGGMDAKRWLLALERTEDSPEGARESPALPPHPHS